MNAQTNLPVKLRSLPEIVAEFDEKWEAIDATIDEFKTSERRVETMCCISGTYAGGVFSGGKSYLSRSSIEKNLLSSAWRHVYKGLNLNTIASAKDRKQFEMAFENPAPFTLDNIRATFGGYIKDPRFHVLKGLAECFCDLDPAYKSHSKVKVGVKGLPKRVIITNCGSYGSWGYERLRDTLNALRVYQGLPHLEHHEYDDFLAMADKDISDLAEWSPLETYRGSDRVQRDGKAYSANGYNSPSEAFDITGRTAHSGWRKLSPHEFGLSLKLYQNGNAHLIFDPEMLKTINRALAEFYGDILPDVEPDKSDLFTRPGTDVSKDLQYYWTPKMVISEIFRYNEIRKGTSVLEPSCGDGRIMDVVREMNPTGSLLGVECHLGRANEAKAKGHNVFMANFLETAPRAQWDYVVMNPPFYGTHWRKHLDHARKFLKPRDEDSWRRGTLICILPASAYYDGHLADIKGEWRDLPVASFNESGTNVPTGFFTCWGEE